MIAPPRKRLSSNRFIFSPISLDRLEDFHQYSTSKEFYEFLEFEPFQSIDETSKYLEKLIHRSSCEKNQYYYVIDKESDELLGTFGLINLDSRIKSIEIGYGINPKHWGKGIFGGVLDFFIPFCFEELDLNKIHAKTDEKNIASIKGLQKKKFSLDGTLRHHYLYSNGTYSNAVVLSILRKDWLKNE
ncbi:GNAT family N-acetyltransferase [Gammaproteobacteria bacterium]|nr:GNAT family N-acetyltransferase [Gammaproteobacteria bacterium]